MVKAHDGASTFRHHKGKKPIGAVPTLSIESMDWPVENKQKRGKRVSL
jgi:hypothetical protein